MTLEGYCVIFRREHNTYPSMTCNIADLQGAAAQVKAIREGGGEVLAVCRESELSKLPPLLKLCGELDIELDGVNLPASAAAVLNAMRRVLREERGQ